ncbi:uncharacterized protein [Nicotiana sylvestris]|uniref:uncharacterized protein n=1 Tax=Nicotiana sylvestris TaxID=4096 RepID=UPI00388C56F2
MYTRFTTLKNELKSLGRDILEEDKVEKILTRVLPVTWESKIIAIQESKNITTLKLYELIRNLTAYELRRQTIKMDAPKKERSLTFRITKGADLEEDEMTMITKDFKKYLMKGMGPSRSRSYNKPRVPEKQTNERCYKCGKTDHHIKGSRRRNRFNPRRTKDQQRLWLLPREKAQMRTPRVKMEMNKHLWQLENPIGILERLSELLLDFIDESEDLNNKKEQVSKECVILKAKCKNLELRASESESKNVELKNQVHELDTTILELRFENLKLKLGTSKKKIDHTQLTLEENVGKMKDELDKRDEQIRVLKEDLNKVKHELDGTCKWNKASDALSWLHEHHSCNKKGLGYGTQAPNWDPKCKYLTLSENKICTHCGKTDHYKNKCPSEGKHPNMVHG